LSGVQRTSWGSVTSIPSRQLGYPKEAPEVKELKTHFSFLQMLSQFLFLSQQSLLFLHLISSQFVIGLQLASHPENSGKSPLEQALGRPSSKIFIQFPSLQHDVPLMMHADVFEE